LVKKGGLIKKRQANIDLCSLNLKGDLSAVFFVEMLRAKEFLDKHSELKNFFKTVKDKVKTSYYSLVVFGSLAKGKETKTSDVDLLIIAPTRLTGEEIERIVSSEAMLLGRKVQLIVLDEKEFVENLASKKLNVVVEAFKNHIIIVGVEGFYNGVKQTL
jgi:predicted nucleotidyltransferase